MRQKNSEGKGVAEEEEENETLRRIYKRRRKTALTISLVPCLHVTAATYRVDTPAVDGDFVVHHRNELFL